jgi:hypothetical protein
LSVDGYVAGAVGTGACVSVEDVAHPQAAPVWGWKRISKPYVAYSLTIGVSGVPIWCVVVERPTIVRSLLRTVGSSDRAKARAVQSSRQH